MNTDIIQGNWKQFKGKVLTKWGKLTNDEIDQAKGNMEILQGTIQKKYGEAKEQTQEYLSQLSNETGYKFDETEEERRANAR